MPIEVVSAPSLNQVAPPQGKAAAEVEADETKSAQAQESAETLEESDTQEATEGSEETEAADGEAEESDADEADETEAKEERPKKKGGVQKRIDKLTRRLSEREQEIEYWKREALKKKEAEGAPQKPEPQLRADPNSKPKADEFETHEEYVEALADWKVEQRLKAHEEKAKETQVKTEFQRQVDEHQKRVEAFKAKHEDFDERLEEVNDIPLSIAVQEVILASDRGPELMYELARDPEEFARICKLSPLAAARELGKVEARLEKSTESKKREVKTTKAPPPPSPISGKSQKAVKKSIYDPSLSQAEYERLRAEQEAHS
ncbi:MAG: hypothetical protein AB7G93_09545 [Bdellovibrionales bacterium]